MPILELPSFDRLERLFAVVAAEAPELLPACRSLVLGPRLGALVLPEPPPGGEELASLLRLLRRQAPELLALGRELVETADAGETALIELCVDKLLQSSDWQHPTQVLERPRPDFEKLLAACRARRKRLRGRRRVEIEAMIEKVERAVRIEAAARQRRQRQRRRRR